MRASNTGHSGLYVLTGAPSPASRRIRQQHLSRGWLQSLRQLAPRVHPTLWIADASLAVMHGTTGGHSGLRAALKLGRRPDPSMQPLSALLGCALTRLGQDERVQPRSPSRRAPEVLA